MKPKDFVSFFREQRASAILRTDIADAAAPAMEAAIAGGFRIVEFTMTIPGVLQRIEEFSRRDDLVVGAGTVLTKEQARDAVQAGASFLVSPVVSPDVIDKAGDLGVAMMPGCHTPTELNLAHEAGAPLQKLFPAPGIGPAFVKATLGPLPFLKIVPTSGVSKENASAWLDAGAWALGFVAPLFDAAEIAEGRFDLVEARARDLLAAIRSA